MENIKQSADEAKRDMGAGPVNILMVDDQPGKLLSYEVMLGELGENLFKASSGREALELLLKMNFAVVLMDVSMPELDGFELADLIRQHPRFQKTAIIFISAVHLTDVDRLKGYQRGAVDYISVPIIPELLRAKVSVFAELHRKAQQLEILNQELNRLSNSLMTAQDEERRRIARELHDGLGQDLTAAKMMLGALNQPQQSPEARERAMAEANTMMDQAIKQVRTISHLLHPPLLDEMGLLSALRWYTDGFQKRSGIETVLEIPAEFPRLGPEVETTIFKIAQESLTNVFRHAEARKAMVKLEERDDQVVISISDDGKGVSRELESLRPGSYGIGIIGIKQRVQDHEGLLVVRSASPGTIIEVSIPHKSARNQQRVNAYSS
jgi:signal transduction histidine kinase